MAAPGPSAGAVALHPLPAGGVAPFAACVRLTAELRAALLAHAQAPHGAAASVTFSAAGAGAVRARVSAFAVAAFGRSHAPLASAAQLISLRGRDYPCVSYAEAEGTCSLYAAAPGAEGLHLAADVQRCVRPSF